MRKNRLMALFLAAMLPLAAGCNTSPAASEDVPFVLPVTVSSPTVGSLEQKTSYIGRVSPASSVYVVPLVGGEVIAVHANAGDAVKAGDLLFEVDSTEIELAIRQAEAGIGVINANLALSQGTSYEAQLMSAKNALDQALSNKKWTQDTYDSYDKTFDATRRTLYNSSKSAENAMKATKTYYENMRTAEAAATAFTFSDGSVAVPTRAQVDAAQAAFLASQTASQTAANAYNQYLDSYESQYNQLTKSLELAELGLNAAQQSYDLVSSGRALEQQTAVLQAQRRQAQTGVEIARQKLSYTKITAPIDGIVEQKNITLHNMASPSSPAYVISQFERMEVAFSVSAPTAARLKIGDEVIVAFGQTEFPAALCEIAASANTATGLVLVTAEFDGAQSPPPGVSVKVTLVSEKAQNVLLIPSKCLYYENGNPYVYAVVDGRASIRRVETGIIANETAVVTEGLTADDKIITTWNPNLADGIDVSVVGEG